MTTYTTERLPGEPIVISHNTADWKIGTHLPEASEAAIAMLEAANEPCYYISDMSLVSMSLDDVIKAANHAARGGSDILHHPLMKQFLLVTNSRLVELAGKGLEHDVFGNVNIRVFTSLEDALTYAREHP